MKFPRSQGMIVSLQWTSILKIFASILVIFMLIFFLSGLLTSLKPEYRFSSSYLNEWTRQMNGNALIHLLGFENGYFTQDLGEDIRFPNLSTFVFEAATSINPDDPRSLLGRELPGFSLFDGQILIAGEGTNYTNMPHESAPPIEVLLQERAASLQQLKELEQQEAEQKASAAANDKKAVYLYATHTRESYLPLLEGVNNPDHAFHDEANVLIIAQQIANELESQGIGAIVEEKDFTKLLHEQGLRYSQSYDVARPTIQEALAANRDITYLIDVHRDSLDKKTTTVLINGVSYARIAFIVGGEHAKYEQNEMLANKLHHLLDEKYPGLSRGVIMKQGETTNGKFNQDLSENALLIEVGGVYNDLQELQRTAKAFGKVFADFYWQAEKVTN